jgi:hypothetical protein
MDKASRNHLEFLKVAYPDLGCRLKDNPRVNVLVKPKVIFNPLNRGVVHTISFDSLLSLIFMFEGKSIEYMMLIDENLSNDVCDSKGIQYAWKRSKLLDSGLTDLQWSYWHINGVETNQVAVSPTISIQPGGTILDTLQAFNMFVYGAYSRN